MRKLAGVFLVVVFVFAAWIFFSMVFRQASMWTLSSFMQGSWELIHFVLLFAGVVGIFFFVAWLSGKGKNRGRSIPPHDGL